MFLNAHKMVNLNIFKKSFFNFVENLRRNKMEKYEKKGITDFPGNFF